MENFSPSDVNGRLDRRNGDDEMRRQITDNLVYAAHIRENLLDLASKNLAGKSPVPYVTTNANGFYSADVSTTLAFASNTGAGDLDNAILALNYAIRQLDIMVRNSA